MKLGSQRKKEKGGGGGGGGEKPLVLSVDKEMSTMCFDSVVDFW